MSNSLKIESNNFVVEPVGSIKEGNVRLPQKTVMVAHHYWIHVMTTRWGQRVNRIGLRVGVY